MDTRIQNSQKNRQAVITSAIVAKAIVKRGDGRINIVVVFQKSTRHEFYWVFQAKSARSARRSWKYVCHFGRDFNTDHKAYTDFQSFTAHYASGKHEVLTVRVHHVRRMAALLAKTDHESIHSDWTPRINTNDPRDVRHQNRRLAKHMSGRVLDIGWNT